MERQVQNVYCSNLGKVTTVEIREGNRFMTHLKFKLIGLCAGDQGRVETREQTNCMMVAFTDVRNTGGGASGWVKSFVVRFELILKDKDCSHRQRAVRKAFQDGGEINQIKGFKKNPTGLFRGQWVHMFAWGEDVNRKGGRIYNVTT